MPAIAIIAGLIVLFIAIRPASGGGSGIPSGAGPNNGLPDPDASNASMAGAAWSTVPDVNVIPSLPGTAKISPGTTFGRMQQTNRVALRGIGTPGIANRIPRGQTVTTSNPATVPYSASGTRSFSGTVATTTNQRGGIKL